jgi:hypothetical protein
MLIHDLEEKIMRCWSIVDDVDALLHLMEIRSVSEDELQNYLIGMQAVGQARFELLFNAFEDALKEVAQYKKEDRREKMLADLFKSLDDQGPDRLPIEDEL